MTCKAKDQYGPLLDLPETKRELRKQNAPQYHQQEMQIVGQQGNLYQSKRCSFFKVVLLQYTVQNP